MSGYSLCLSCMENTWLNQDGQKSFRTCVYRFTILLFLFIAVTAEKIRTAMLNIQSVRCKRFCKPYQGKKNSVAYLLDTAPL